MGLRLSIVTPVRPLLDVDAEQVVAPGSEGEFGVLPGHAAMLVELRPGVVRWVEAGRPRRAAISGGFAEVTHERVTVLTPVAELPEQIDATEAESRRSAAAAALANAGFASPSDQLEKLREAAESAQARVDALRA